MVLYHSWYHPRGSLTSFVISFSLLVHLLHAAADTPDNMLSDNMLRKANCTGESYTPNSPFATNLATLLSYLTTKSSAINSATANITARNSSSSVYGLFMCQGDLSSLDCQACISTAAGAIPESCPAARQAIFWYDNCQFRYSDFNFFGIPNTAGFNMTNPFQKTTSKEPFKLVSDLVKTAPLRRPMFASKALPGNLYGLAQCTPDLSIDGCSKCLTTILADIKACCTQHLGWRYLAYSCWVRYEATPFLKNLNGTSTEIVRDNCSNSTFPPNSLAVMESNLNNLLSNLTIKAQSTGFYNTTIGNSPNQLYGLALCRGDLIPPSNDCNTCLSDAGRSIAGDCPNSTAGIKWYEKCLMRYSDHNFFGVADLAGQFLCGVDQINQAGSDATFKFATGLLGQAANNPLMVAAGEEQADNSSSSYVLVQCTRDLTSKGCKNCLENGLNQVAIQCKLANGWRYLSGSCTLRYEVFPFFNTLVIPPPGPPPMAPPQDGERRKNKTVAIVASILGAVLLASIVSSLWWRLNRENGGGRAQFSDISPLPDADLPLMDLAIIQAATGNFSDKNKLGEGGFGPVYKGIIHGTNEIAVKRLSQKSKQGDAEFKNEVKLIAKLQHRNLVRMLGCCIENGEKLLVYEFLPNKSLDTFLFDPNKRAQLDWNRRVHIIAGIARGLLYLHEDSRLRVVHRDLKASNVLLDNEMNPKISDFGMAKIYGADESEVNTNRIVGTYGYMAPEYAMDGLFSVKSDVYSFGILLLEIISGEKNGRSHFERYGQTLPRHAWQLWNVGNAMELMDPMLEGSYPTNEAMKCIYIGLLCVQENSEERPTMSLVVHMLRGDETSSPQPTQPPTFIRQRASLKNKNIGWGASASASDLSSNTHSSTAHSTNELTQSIIEPR